LRQYPLFYNHADSPEKIGLPQGATVLAIRNPRQTDIFLQLDHVTNEAILHLPEFLG
jgi:hypothetical protein